MKSTTIAEKLNAELMCERRNEIVSLLTQSIIQKLLIVEELDLHWKEFKINIR